MKKIQIFSSWFFITLNLWLSGVNVVLFTLNLQWNTLNSPQLTLWVQGQSLFSFDHLMIIIFIVGLTWPITTITIVIINFFNRGADDLLEVTASKQRSPTYVQQPALHLPPFTFYLTHYTFRLLPFTYSIFTFYLTSYTFPLLPFTFSPFSFHNHCHHCWGQHCCWPTL